MSDDHAEWGRRWREARAATDDPLADLKAMVEGFLAADRAEPLWCGLPFPFTPEQIRAVPVADRYAFLRTADSLHALLTVDQLRALYDIGLERPKE